MKTFKQILFLCFLAVLTACSEDVIVSQSEELLNAENGSVDLISMVVPDIEIDAMTRSQLYEEDSELKFAWQENDAIGVIPLSGFPTKFPINADNIQNNTAVFDGGGWSLSSSMKYAAFFPFNNECADKGIKSITINYTGQNQKNYTDYDFLATGAVQPTNGQVVFNMKRLSAVLKIRITMPAGSYARYGTLIGPSMVFGVKGTLDLSGSEPVYSATELTKFIHTQYDADKTSTSAWVFDVYMMIPPVDLSGQTLKFRITSSKDFVYEATLTGKNFEAGKAYLLEATADNAKLSNTYLIEAAEGYNSIVFNRVNGIINVNDPTNQALLKEVKKIIVNGKKDPTVLDEIGYFKNLEYLECVNSGRNSLTDLSYLDVSNNPKLTYLCCRQNNLTSLDISKNLFLTKLVLGINKLTSLDVSKLSALTYLSCNSNQLTSLDVSNNLALTELMVVVNQLSYLDVSKNTELTYLNCGNNQLIALDVSNNTALKTLYCQNNQLTTLNVDNNKDLETLLCHDNNITKLTIDTGEDGLYKLEKLDISNNTHLDELNCFPSDHATGGNGKLNTLNVSGCTKLSVLNCGWNLLTSLDLSTNTELYWGLTCHNNLLKTVNITKCTQLRLSSVFCGSQWSDVAKTTSRPMTLYYTSQNTGTFNHSSGYNTDVTLVLQ